MGSKNAFTMMEVIVIIAVVGILMSITVPRVKAMNQNGNVLKATKELATLKNAIETYRTFDSSHAFPPSTTTLQGSYLITASPKMVPGILYDPFGATQTTEYNYLRSANGKYYVIWSVGLSGQSQPTAISNTGTISY